MKLLIRAKHILADEYGNFPVGILNEWELAVVNAELGYAESARSWPSG